MSLLVVAVPIGNEKDITLRALEALRSVDLVVGEEIKVARRLLFGYDIRDKEILSLSEHTGEDELQELVAFCSENQVALISDCGTPSFCDPGARLVFACRQRGIPVTSLPGPSSLMCLLSMSSQSIKEFVFVGFLPANREERQHSLNRLKGESRAMVIMDTPYRLKRLINELSGTWPQRQALLGMNLTESSETYLEGSLLKLKQTLPREKAEFILLVYPLQASSAHRVGGKKRTKGRSRT